MRNAELDEVQVGIKISGRNINNLGYADDTAVMAESEEELKSFLIKLKYILKTKIMASGPITPRQIDRNNGTVRDFIFLDSKITAGDDCGLEIKDACSLEEKL